LEAVDVETPREGDLDIAEEVVHLGHARLVVGVDEFTAGGFATNEAMRDRSSSLLGEAVSTKEAVAVQDEFSHVFETVLAFVAMLRFLVHSSY
jgi:hypothetical protein